MQTFNTTTNPIVHVPNGWADLDGNINDNPQLMAQLNDLINKQLYFSDVNNLTKALDKIVGESGEIYIGGLPTAEGTWKIQLTNDGDLGFYRLESETWNPKYVMSRNPS